MDIALDVCSINKPETAEEWKSVYDDNPKLSVFSSYEFNYLFVKKFYRNAQRRGMKIIIVRIKKDGKAVMFLPLCLRHDKYYMLWDYSSVPFCDAVYASNLSVEFFDSVFYKLPEIIGNNTVFFKKMKPDSDFTRYLSTVYTPYRKNPCEKLRFLKSYRNVYMMMDCKFKRKYEAGRERIASAGKCFHTDFYYNRPIPAAVGRNILSLVCDRKTLFSLEKERWREKASPLSEYVKKGRNNFLAISYISGIPCAFVSGFIKESELIVVRCRFFADAPEYHIKSIVWCSLIEYCIEKLNLKSIDFCGCLERDRAEMMGAAPYRTLNFEIKL